MDELKSAMVDLRTQLADVQDGGTLSARRDKHDRRFAGAEVLGGDRLAAMHGSDRRIIVVGAGGHAKVVIDVLRSAGWHPEGLLDPSYPSPPVSGVPVIGTDEAAADLRLRGIRYAFVAIGRNDLRRRLCRELRALGFELPNAIHATASISTTAVLGTAIAVMPNAVIHAEAHISDFAIINTGAIVEHDCVIGEASHVAPRSALGGSCRLGDEVFFGIGAVARPESIIGDRAVVGAGATVVGTIEAGATVVGNPARRLAQRRAIASVNGTS
jgi:UDP-perosamine 4-acetyltransferase